MRLWLLRQAHPDLSKLELEVSTSCLSKISLLRLLLGQTNRDKDFPESLRYSERPNISGTFGVRPYVDWSGCTGAFSQWRDGGNQDKGVSLVQEITSNRITDFDASSVSSLYQNDLTEVRVNALFGMYLIRSYEV